MGLVLHNMWKKADGTFGYICDVWRVWSPPQVKGAPVHHQLMHEIDEYYGKPLELGGKPLVENYNQRIVYTDGHPDVYKSYKNVGPLSYWQRKQLEGPYPNNDQGFKHASGVKVIHVMFTCNHASGVVDQAGKVRVPCVVGRVFE